MADQRMMDLIIPTAIAITGVAIFLVVHPAQKFAFLPSMILAFVCYLRTSYRMMPKPEAVLPIYLIGLAIQFLHFTEEYVYGFHFRVAEIMAGMPPFDPDVFVAFNMIAYALFILGAVGIYRGIRFSMIIVWFFAIGGALGNAIWHPLLAIRVGGYFPGLFTSLLYWILAPLLLKRLWKPGNSAPAVTG